MAKRPGSSLSSSDSVRPPSPHYRLVSLDLDSPQVASPEELRRLESSLAFNRSLGGSVPLATPESVSPVSAPSTPESQLLRDAGLLDPMSIRYSPSVHVPSPPPVSVSTVPVSVSVPMSSSVPPSTSASVPPETFVPAAASSPGLPSGSPPAGSPPAPSFNALPLDPVPSPVEGPQVRTVLVAPAAATCPSVVELTKALRSSLVSPASVQAISPRISGIHVRTRYVEHVCAVLARSFPYCAVSVLDAPRTLVEVHLRGIGAAYPVDEVLQDIREQMAPVCAVCDIADVHRAFPSLRRLHGRTEGAVDKERPLPVLVLQLDERLVEPFASSYSAFGVLPVAVSPARSRTAPVQCRRCLRWGHRAGACQKKQRCFFCGDTAHLASACPERPPQSAPKSSLRCVNCLQHGHMALWAGWRVRNSRSASALAKWPRINSPKSFGQSVLRILL